ncbi:hypothetical protein [Micromonospora ureilytica]|uniref:hypothetical protein n=1 Tax=Micromonospora ureilytica TaxID=709868 RepID=UPI002E11553B|nr:hypothetical protein OHB55_33130 [Micromonospora ureilytica]
MTKKEKEGPEEVPDDERSTGPTSPPAVPSPAERGLTASAIACDLAADLLEGMGRDGLAVTAKAIAHLLHLIAMFLRHNDRA